MTGRLQQTPPGRRPAPRSVIEHARGQTIAGAAVLTSILLVAGAAAAQEGGWPIRDDLRFDFYGQINQAYLSYDDGTDSRGFLTVDNSNNDDGSFIGIVKGGYFDSGWTWDGRFEVSIAPRRSDEVSLQNPAGPGYEIDAEDIRYAEFAFATVGAGIIYFGQGDMSANLDAPDYSGTSVIQGPNVSQIAGDMLLRFVDGTLSDRTLSDAIGTFDSGRRFRLRYDSPVFAGFSGSASIGREVLTSGDDNTYVDLVGRFTHSNAIWDYAVVASVTTIEDNEYAGMLSFGYLHKPSGINLTFTGTHSTLDKHYFYFKAGLIRNLFAWGPTAIAFDWYNNGNWAADGAETETFGLSIVQRIDRANLDLYAAVRSFDAYTNIGIPDEDFQKSDAVIAGLRWTF